MPPYIRLLRIETFLNFLDGDGKFYMKETDVPDYLSAYLASRGIMSKVSPTQEYGEQANNPSQYGENAVAENLSTKQGAYVEP